MEELGKDILFSDEIQENLPIFLKKWWLDVVASNRWHYIASRKNNLIVIWPILHEKKFFLKISRMPPFTQYLGPYILKDKNMSISISEEIEIYESLLKKISIYNVFKQRLNLGVKNLLPFIWQKFNTSVRYTYRIDTSQKMLGNIFKNMSATRRRKIKKGSEVLVAEKGTVNEKFLQLIMRTFIRKHENIPDSIDLLTDIYKQSMKNDSGVIINAKKQNSDEIWGTAFFVQDKFALYYLIGAYDDKVDKEGLTSSFLIWEGIKLAKEKGLVFDFEGSVLKGVEYFFRSFGGELNPYYEVSRIKPSVLNFIYRRLK
ncbi:MAG: hypothetical protein H0Z29_01780 [Candidatus Marinimicrobia bacterium]|nr:hypothetical protein [Candidatus Neomarinimicrobiota bacterium]